MAKTRIRVIFYFFVGIFLLCDFAYGDTLIFKNGRKLEGIVQKVTDDQVALRIGFGTAKFQRSQIEHIVRSSESENKSLQFKWDQEKSARDLNPPSATSAPKTVNIDKVTGGIAVDAFLDKKIKAKLILDTGASLVMLSQDIARKLGLNLNRKNVIQAGLADGRKVDAIKVVLDYMSVHGVELRNVDAAVILTGEKVAAGYDGLLGMSFLNKFNFRIDPKNGELTLERLR